MPCGASTAARLEAGAHLPDDMSVRVPLVVNVALAGRAKGSAAPAPRGQCALTSLAGPRRGRSAALGDERSDRGEALGEERHERLVHEVRGAEHVGHVLAVDQRVDGRDAAALRARVEVIDTPALEAEAGRDGATQAVWPELRHVVTRRRRGSRPLAPGDQRREGREAVAVEAQRLSNPPSHPCRSAALSGGLSY